MFDKLLSLIAPHSCLGCGQEGYLVCEWCIETSFDSPPARCCRCYAVSVDSEVCAKCRKQTSLLNVWVTSIYAGLSKDLLHAYKFERAIAGKRVITDRLDALIPVLPNGTVVTFVPTSSHRRRLRGYDQSELIAKDLSKRRGLKFEHLLTHNGGDRQLGANRKQRFEQASRTYAFKRSKNAPHTVLIIDDVLTTGATLESTARVLKKAGSKRVYGAVFAQKQR